MNGQNHQPQTDQKLWEKISAFASRADYAEVIIKIHNRRIELVEYTLKEKPENPQDLTIFPL